MLLWFAGTSLVAMWFFFRDPAIDHRLVVVGALLPDAIDGLTGGAWLLHTLMFPIAFLLAVMVLTIGRRQARRRYLALPIGCFWHLIFDFVWSDTSTFWWPVAGLSFGDTALPVVERGVVLNLGLEAVGLVLLIWIAGQFDLANPGRRTVFLRTGRVDRALTDPDREPPTC